MDINGVMDGLGERLSTIAGLTVVDYTPDKVFPPIAVVDLPEISYDSTMARGCDDGVFTITVFVSRNDAETARDTLSEYMAGSGDKSVKAAIEGDVSLGGAAQTVRVMSATPQYIDHGNVKYLAADFTVHVVA